MYMFIWAHVCMYMCLLLHACTCSYVCKCLCVTMHVTFIHHAEHSISVSEMIQECLSENQWSTCPGFNKVLLTSLYIQQHWGPKGHMGLCLASVLNSSQSSVGRGCGRGSHVEVSIALYQTHTHKHYISMHWSCEGLLLSVGHFKSLGRQHTDCLVLRVSTGQEFKSCLWHSPAGWFWSLYGMWYDKWSASKSATRDHFLPSGKCKIRPHGCCWTVLWSCTPLNSLTPRGLR